MDDMLTPCSGCRNFGWCRRHGCTFWNRESRERLRRLEKHAMEQNDLMDEIEREIQGWK